jgi:aspartyl-tRNA(Asn)/glutamyl-tRNA(Gln) amidotransferase subunit A
VRPPTAPAPGPGARRLALEELRGVWERFDLLAAPTMPVLAPRIGDETVELDGRPLSYRLSLIRFNSPWSLIGSPALTVPCGFVDGLPVGLLLAGRRFDEATVLRAGHAFQGATDWHERRPEAIDGEASQAVYRAVDSLAGRG